MFYMEPGGSSDRDAVFQRGKIARRPRPTLSMDVKSIQSNQDYMELSSTSPYAEMPYSSPSLIEIDEVGLHQNKMPTSRQYVCVGCSSDNMGAVPDDENHCLNESAYPALLPPTSHDISTTACTAERPSAKHYYYMSPSYPQHTRDTQFDNPYSGIQPASFYPSPPQSAKTSPLDMSNPVLPPVHPSPSLPLHQPRPSRRIPIVSLSRLASACDEMEKSPHRRVPPYRNEPLPRNIHYPYQRRSPYSKLDRNRQVTRPVFPQEDIKTGRIPGCSCDCMDVPPAG